MSPRIAIIGGGFSGAVTAVQLARRLPGAAAIDVIEPRPTLGGGVAYSAPDPAHRINVPASRMTVFTDDPEHFSRWLQAQGVVGNDPEARWAEGADFPWRQVFGRYVAEQVEDARRARADLSLRHVRASATAVTAGTDGFSITLDDGSRISADAVVLAMSHPPPAVPAALRPALAQGAPIIADPWAAGALDAIELDSDVAIIGTGLSMADVVSTLDRRGHAGSILAVSRRGLLSRGHVFGGYPTWDRFGTLALPRGAAALCRLVRAEVRRAAEAGIPWQAVFDDIRTNGRRVWESLDEAGRRRVVRHLRPFWDVHRFRVAPQAEAAIARLRAAGGFRSVAAALVGATWDGEAVTLRLRPRRAGTPFTWRGHAVVVTTGPAHGDVLLANPALASLARGGLVQADRVGLGLEVDAASRPVGAGGAVNRLLFLVGPLARGRFGELMGLPQVSEHAALVAEFVADALLSNPPAHARAAMRQPALPVP